jgi:ParB family chromosome partitioning protein
MSENDRKAASRPQKGLGRGLAALLRDEPGEAARPASAPGATPATASPAVADQPAGNAELDALRREAVTLPVEFLQPGRFQPRHRFDEGALDQLAASLKQKGMLQPIVVRPLAGRKDAYEILAGERRWRAAQRAKLHEVPVVLRSFSDRDALEIALIENLQRQDLSAIEEAEGYRRLKDEFDATQEELAAALGKSRSHIANALRLLELPPAVRKLLDEGRLSAGHARAIAASPEIETLAARIVEQGLSVREAEKLAQTDSRARRHSSPRVPGSATAPRLSADAQALRRRLEQALGLKVELTVKPNSEATSVILHCTDYDQLDEVARRLERPAGRG